MTSNSKDFFSVVEYCQELKNQIITFQSLNPTSTFNPNEKIKNAYSESDVIFYLVLAETAGEITRALKDINNVQFPFLNWRGDSTEKMGKRTFQVEMNNIWPQF